MKKTIVFVLVFFSQVVYANNSWNSNFTYHGKTYDAGSTGGINQTIKVNGSQITFRVDSNNCYRDPTASYVDDCDRSIRRSQLRSHSTTRMGQDTRYSFSVNKLTTGGDANRGEYINFFEIKPNAGMSMTVPTMTLNVNPKTSKMNIIQSLGNHSANPASKNDIKTYIGNLKKGWNNFRVDTKQSPGGDGYLRIYQNGKLIYNYTGKTSYPHNRDIKYWIGGYICCGRINQLLQNGEPDHVFKFTNISAGPINNNPPNNNTGPNNAFSKYVDMYGDLKAAYNRNSGGKSKADWGKWHYCSYGKNEGRAGLTPAHCLGSSTANVKPKIRITQNDIDSCQGRDNCFQFANIVSDISYNPSNMFSYNDYIMFNFGPSTSDHRYLLGFTGKPYDNRLDQPIAFGIKHNNTIFAMALDNSYYGSKNNTLFGDGSTRYFVLNHKKEISPRLNFDITGTIGTATARPGGDIVNIGRSYAVGFDAIANYTINEKNAEYLKFSLIHPLRLQDATVEFANFIADIEPDGRELQFSASYGKNINRRVKFESDLSYVMDEGNTSGNDNAIIMFYIKWDA